MNDTLKGFRTLIVTGLAALLGNVDVVVGAMQDIALIIDTQLSDGGALATLVVAAVSIKQIITDALPRLKGEV